MYFFKMCRGIYETCNTIWVFNQSFSSYLQENISLKKLERSLKVNLKLYYNVFEIAMFWKFIRILKSIIDRIEGIFKLLEYIRLYVENNIHDKLNLQFSIKIVYFWLFEVVAKLCYVTHHKPSTIKKACYLVWQKL